MASRSLSLTDALHHYIAGETLREPAILAELRAETARLPEANMQIGPEQGQFMALLVELIGATRTLEVGTFTGYSALRVALALPAAGRVTACDISAEYTAVARRYWARAGVADKIDLRLAPAVETLDALLAEGLAVSYDFAFIDADKTGYDAYYERSLLLLRPGGLIVVDNVLWGGDVADPAKTDADTRAVRALNAKVRADERVSMSLIQVGDGLLLARKLP